MSTPIKRKELLLKLKSLATKKKITQEQIGEQIDMRTNNVNRTLSGSVNVTLDTVIDIATALGKEITIK